MRSVFPPRRPRHWQTVSDNLQGLTVNSTSPTSGAASIEGIIDHVAAYNNDRDGMDVLSLSDGLVNVTIVDSVASNNNNNGIYVENANVPILNSVMSNNTAAGFYGQGSGATIVEVRNSTATTNGCGFCTINKLLLSHSMVTRNLTGVGNGDSRGTVYSYGDNDINSNVKNIDGTLIPVATL